MTFLVSAIIMAAVSTLLQFIIYTYLYLTEKQSYFRIWAVSWVFYLLRFFLEIAIFYSQSNILWVCLQLSIVFNGIFLLSGAYRFIGKRFSQGWIISCCAVILWIFISQWLNLSFFWITMASFLFVGLIYIRTGILFMRNHEISGPGKHLTGWGLILWGIHKLNYPLLRPVEWIAEWGFLLGFILGFIVAIGTILAYFDKFRIERKRVEEELREGEERYRQVVECFPGPILIQSEGKCVFANPAMAKLYGITDPQKLYGMKVLDRIPPHLRRIVESRIQAVNSGMKIPVLEIQLIRADGSIIDVEVAPTPFIYDKKPAALILAKDISERKRYEEQLRKLSYAVEQSPTMIAITDKNGYVEYINPRFTKIRGFTPDDVIGKHFSIFGMNRQNPQEPPVFSNGKEWQGELLSSKKNGEVFWELATFSPIRDQAGEITHYLKIGEDITRRKQEEQELQKAKAEAEAANRSKSQFLANISHEIRTAMNCINGMTELLLTSQIAPSQKEYLELIKSSSDSLINLINDILDLSRIEAGKLRLEQKIFDFRDMIREIVKIYQFQAEQKGLSFDYFIAPEVPASLSGDPGRLRQVLANLLGNAVKFTQKGSVTLRIEVQNESSITVHILFLVSDTGIGIQKEKMDLLFKNFSQVDGLNPGQSNGSGLGLAICKQLIELMNGRVWVESEAGVGSTFSFMVPFLKSKTLEPPATVNNLTAIIPDRRLENIGGKVKVLVVEDHPVNQRFVSATLQKIGAKVVLASSGVKALEILETEIFDLILMDVQMPEMDGYETTIKIRGNERLTNRHTPIIALTAYAMEEDKQQCLAAGMDGYLSKPINTVKLHSLVRHLYKIKLFRDNGAEPPPIDLTATLRIVDGDFQLVSELVTGLKKDCPQHLAELVKAYQKNDFVKLKQLSHRFKGALTYFGAEKALDLVGQIEQSVQLMQVESIAPALRELEREIGRIIEFIEHFERGNCNEGFNC